MDNWEPFASRFPNAQDFQLQVPEEVVDLSIFKFYVFLHTGILPDDLHLRRTNSSGNELSGQESFQSGDKVWVSDNRAMKERRDEEARHLAAAAAQAEEAAAAAAEEAALIAAAEEAAEAAAAKAKAIAEAAEVAKSNAAAEAKAAAEAAESAAAAAAVAKVMAAADVAEAFVPISPPLSPIRHDFDENAEDDERPRRRGTSSVEEPKRREGPKKTHSSARSADDARSDEGSAELVTFTKKPAKGSDSSQPILSGSPAAPSPSPSRRAPPRNDLLLDDVEPSPRSQPKSQKKVHKIDLVDDAMDDAPVSEDALAVDAAEELAAPPSASPPDSGMVPTRVKAHKTDESKSGGKVTYALVEWRHDGTDQMEDEWHEVASMKGTPHYHLWENYISKKEKRKASKKTVDDMDFDEPASQQELPEAEAVREPTPAASAEASEEDQEKSVPLPPKPSRSSSARKSSGVGVDKTAKTRKQPKQVASPAKEEEEAPKKSKKRKAKPTDDEPAQENEEPATDQPPQKKKKKTDNAGAVENGHSQTSRRASMPASNAHAHGARPEIINTAEALQALGSIVSFAGMAPWGSNFIFRCYLSNHTYRDVSLEALRPSLTNGAGAMVDFLVGKVGDLQDQINRQRM